METFGGEAEEVDTGVAHALPCQPGSPQTAVARQAWDRVRIACNQWAQARRQWEKQDAAGLEKANSFLNQRLARRCKQIHFRGAHGDACRAAGCIPARAHAHGSISCFFGAILQGRCGARRHNATSGASC